MRSRNPILVVLILGCVPNGNVPRSVPQLAPAETPRVDTARVAPRVAAGGPKIRASWDEVLADVSRGECTEDELIEVIRSDDYFYNQSVGKDLASLGVDVVIPIAWKMFEIREPDTNSLNRAMCILLGIDGIPYKADFGRMARRLTSLLDHDDPKIRECAVRLFPSLEGSTPLPKLVSMLGDPDRFVRRQVVDSLGLTGGRAERDAIRDWLATVPRGVDFSPFVQKDAEAAMRAIEARLLEPQ